ncbi:MAG: cyclic nucleotide-binding domain-containing protein [Actinomycetota bacterium]
MAGQQRSKAKLESLIKSVPLLSACSKKELRSIANVSKVVRFEPGDVICQEGEVGVGMHMVISGQTKVQIGGRTRRRLGPGAFFGEIALLDGGPRTATVIAETPVETLFVAFWNFKTVLKREPGLAVKVLEEVCSRIRATDTSINY